jgi:hypothetical protein
MRKFLERFDDRKTELIGLLGLSYAEALGASRMVEGV